MQILHRGKKVGTERIWYGDKENIATGTEQEFWMVLPKAEIPHIKAKYTLDGKELTAPISAHQRVGEIELTTVINRWRTGRWLPRNLSGKAACFLA